MTGIILFLILLSTTAQVIAEDCVVSKDQILDSEFVDMLVGIDGVIKKDFKKRKTSLPSYKSLLNITTNFKVPVLGADNYFGNIYLVKGKSGSVKYRDELIAESRYKEEVKDDSFYTSEYKTSDINSPSGLVLIKKAGAEVKLTSTNFSTTTGGSINLKVKGPGDKIKSLKIDVVISNGNIKNYLVIAGVRYPFDNMKINAEKSIFGGHSILSGVESVEFTSNGQLTKTILIEDQ